VKTKPLKNLSDLTPSGKEPVASPALESEPLHRRLARLARELGRATEELQSFNVEWTKRNLRAQSCRQAIPTPEITFTAYKRRELAARIQEIQSQIGIANRERRQLDAGKTSQKKAAADTSERLAIPVKRITSSKACPLRSHRDWPAYFLLAAREELAPGLFEQIERSAKSLLQHRSQPESRSHDAPPGGAPIASF
jgi:hypothetical protein